MLLTRKCGAGRILVQVKLSRANQETAVGEGLALGCVALGVESFNAAKMTIEFAFVRAWRDWSYRSHFPAVRADLRRNDLLRIISKSPRRRSAHLTGWASEWPFVPFISESWNIEDVAEMLEEQTEVPLRGWIDLAQPFLDQLSPECWQQQSLSAALASSLDTVPQDDRLEGQRIGL
jgi:hypothetical protein